MILITIGLLVCVLLPALPRYKVNAQHTQCISNLRQMGTAFRLWSSDQSPRYPMALSVTNGGSLEYVLTGQLNRHFQIMSNELSTPKLLTCPADTRRTASNFASLQNSNISYFVDLDADESNPRLFMAGDRNWQTNGVAIPACLCNLTTNDLVWWTKEIHGHSGNVTLADGAAQEYSSEQLQSALTNYGTNLIRLAFP